MNTAWLHRFSARTTAEAARDAAGQLLESGRAQVARVEQAALVLGTTLTYDYCPTGRAWHARFNAGRLTWTIVYSPASPAMS